jgi:hypothetical protein
MLSREHVACASSDPTGAQLALQVRHYGFPGKGRMNSRICLCCGEPMSEKGNALSRNPNICASCSSLADGMEESSLPESTGPVAETIEPVAPEPIEQHAEEPAVRHFPT